MKIFLLLTILLKIEYPTSNIEDIRHINKIVDNSFKAYCFLDIEYEVVNNYCQADLVITPNVVFEDSTWIGATSSNFRNNKKLLGIPKIYLIESKNSNFLEKVLIHELGHFFGYTQHSLDILSVFYPIMIDYKTQTITRYDTLVLQNLLKF